jgi:putative ABC transport system permease protein
MIRNFFLSAWRNMLKTKLYSALNIFGLATGMTATLLISLWVIDEITFDTYHRDHSRIAQVMDVYGSDGAKVTDAYIAIPLAGELRDQYPSDLKRVVLASSNRDHIMAAEDKKIQAKGMWAEPDFPGLFTFKMEEGGQTALNDPSSILLSHTLANILFGRTDPMNRIIRVDNKRDMKVAGVYEDMPFNSTFHQVSFLLPWKAYISEDSALIAAQTQWDYHGFQLFIETNNKLDFNRLSQRIKDIPSRHIKEKEEIFLHPMDKWHLYSSFNDGKVDGGRIQLVWLFGIIGGFVLTLACINFMNLSTARSELRAREVGIRKALGSRRVHLILQYLCESILVAFLATVLSVLLAWFILPFFNNLADKQISIPWGNATFWLMVIVFTIVTGLFAGCYPAFYLSGFNPVSVLKGTFKAGKMASLPRKVLVVIQFTISITLIIGTITVFRQIQYVKGLPRGYSTDGAITIQINTHDLQGHYNALRSDLIHTGTVQDMAESSNLPTNLTSFQVGFDWRGKTTGSLPEIGTVSVSHDFGHTIGWAIEEGRDFSRNFAADSGAFILNESAAKLVGFKNPVGEKMSWWGNSNVIVGVVKNMVMQSPYTTVQPTIFILNYTNLRYISVRIKPEVTLTDALVKIKEVFKYYNPGSPFLYHFMDEQFEEKFDNERRIGMLFDFFAVLAIFISCIGLFGLSSFVATQRTKEIGVRKVLGASIFNLWKLLSKEFILLVMLSFFIASLLARFILHVWLRQYVYHTELNWWVFALAGVMAGVITLITVSFQAIRAALANPITSLRIE